jgi:hypothetical protein
LENANRPLDLPIAFSNGIMGPMGKGYAFGFMIVVLVVLLGLYVAFTGFMSTREALRAQATPVPTSQLGQATRAAKLHSADHRHGDGDANLAAHTRAIRNAPAGQAIFHPTPNQASGQHADGYAG